MTFKDQRRPQPTLSLGEIRDPSICLGIELKRAEKDTIVKSPMAMEMKNPWGEFSTIKKFHER